jgi:thioredoxin-like negative regulator of GroEL
VTKSSETAALLFFTSSRSGPARRMDSLLAQLARRERGRLRVVTVNAETCVSLVEALGVGEIPTLVLLRNGDPVARIEGRASASEIDAMIRQHLPDASDTQAA